MKVLQIEMRMQVNIEFQRMEMKRKLVNLQTHTCQWNQTGQGKMAQFHTRFKVHFTKRTDYSVTMQGHNVLLIV